MSLRLFVSAAIVAIGLSAVAEAQELGENELPSNWNAPPFWSAPTKPAKGVADAVGSLDAEAADVVPSPPMPFVATNPCRIADTRGLGFTGQAGPPALSVGVPRVFQITGTVAGVPTQCGIPASAQAVSFQFSVTGMNSAGNLIAWPDGPPPTTSVLNWNANSVAIGNGIVVPLNGTGGVSVQLNGLAGAITHLIIDVNGYYAPVGIVNTVNGLSGAVTLAAGTNVTITPSGNTLTVASTGGGSGWSLTGNAGTNPTTNFLGTTDNQRLELKVNGQRVLRLEPTVGTPHVIGGSSANAVSATGADNPVQIVGATIGGGGTAGQPNLVQGAYGTIGGGINNLTAPGGVMPVAVAANTVGGGENNQARGHHATVAGGQGNVASSNNSFVGGGVSNTAFSSLAADPTTTATIAGGLSNDARGSYAFIGGGANNDTTDQYGVVAGGSGNRAGDAAGNSSDRPYATVGGGLNNVAAATAATVPGGDGNTASGAYSFAAGRRAKAIHDGSFVWGDATNADVTSTGGSQFLVRANGGAKFLRGVAAPNGSDSALQVEQGGASGEVAWLWSRSAASVHSVVRLLKHPTPTTDFLQCTDFDGVTTTNRCHVNDAGTFVAGSDFAEALPARGGKKGYEPGDVLVLSSDTDGVEKSSKRYDTRAIGVYSTRPGFLGAEKSGETRVDPDDVPVAISGIVPTKVTAENGPIARGDLLTTSSTPGHAMKALPVSVAGVDIYPPGTILGKALDPSPGERGVIRVLVMAR